MITRKKSSEKLNGAKDHLKKPSDKDIAALSRVSIQPSDDAEGDAAMYKEQKELDGEIKQRKQ